ncbi:receptor-like protein kinase HSL1 isoform X1 [Lolium rigidum]|uniref:receptor-like protein kinase HSL1 isoform X1 n=1 Tax=Lolium rigidum TaxID=89674 RepID=UPI001F5D38C0|nr:receptor-like protein kinase HSL1 isoform X1 [Lolium rigidum]
MAALHFLLPLLALLVLLPPHTVGGSDADHLLAAKAELTDPTGALSGWDTNQYVCAWPHVTCGRNSTAAVDGLFIYYLSIAGVFPASVCSLRSLQRLNLAGNDLVGPLPTCLAGLPELFDLDLSGNDFSGEVPAAYGGGFRSLVVLKLVQNSLSGEFPAFLTNLTTLKVLQLAYNPFRPSPLPENLGDLSSLRELYLASCNLTGKIPSSIGNLGNLGNLDLSYNRLSGEIPTSIGNLSSLFQMEVYSNQLSGRIPEGLGSLKKLRNIDISMNLLTGELPEDMFAGPSLVSVHMYQNQLTGRLPASLGTARRLADLRMFLNQIEGPFPPEFGKNCPLEFLDMSNNRMSGPIPTTVCDSGNLTHLVLLGNQFEGAIPAELGQCRTLLRIRLFNNSLSGPVPPEFWGLPHVSMLELRSNALSGTVDPAIGGAKDLSNLQIQDNRFTGVLPAELGNLSNLQELLASDNNFSGPVPQSLDQLSQLSLLDLSSNSLSGEIPRGIGRLKKLTLLNLSHNHLTRIIPPEIAEISMMYALDLSNNELSGGVPVQLQNLHLTDFNLSYNKLSGPLPLFFSAPNYRQSFLGNPGLCYGSCTSDGDPDAIRRRRARINMVASILAPSAVILLIGLAWFTYKYRSYKKRTAETDCEKSSWVLTSFHKVEFSLMDIVNSLDENNVIGKGAAGKVYRSVVGPRSEAVAVKKLWATGTVAKKDDTFEAEVTTDAVAKKHDTFEAEVATLSKIRHKNIIKLFCSVTNSACRLLVYEFMPNGSLGDLLHTANAGILDWPTRFKIAVHAAEGLCYLHHDCVPSIIHRDVKSNNILLDAEFGAKVADFGVAKIVEDGRDTMSVIAGSCGYIAPEYAYTLHVTEKSDVFSFGVVILELVTGKSPITPEIGEKDLVAWVCDNIDQNNVESVLDHKIVEQFKNEMRKVLNIGLLCVNKSPEDRPPMRSVVKMLLEVEGENKP